MLLIIVFLIVIVAVIDTSGLGLSPRLERLLYVVDEEDEVAEVEPVNSEHVEDEDILVEDLEVPEEFGGIDNNQATRDEVLEAINKIYNK